MKNESHLRSMKINWHRLFGLLLTDYFSERGFIVELEKDLSLKRQFLDVVIIERKDREVDLSEICDGFDNLTEHNLLTYKSRRQSLNTWAIEELISHYVNYRKILGRGKVSGKGIGLYAVSTRCPVRLLSMAKSREVLNGVHDIQVLSRTVRIIVLSRLPLEQRNAVLAFFSFDSTRVKFALENYQWRMKDGSTVINQLLEKYSLEGIAVPYTMEQFRKDYIKAHLSELDAKEVLRHFKVDELLRELRPEERLKGLRPEERLKGLRPEEIGAYLKQLEKKARRGRR